MFNYLKRKDGDSGPVKGTSKSHESTVEFLAFSQFQRKLSSPHGSSVFPHNKPSLTFFYV
jgi:hypothetical protein